MTEQKEPLIDISDLSRIYSSGENEVRALDSVSLRIWSGEFVAIMGQSGSGKSTLMNILGCLDSPSSGYYFLNGYNVANCDANSLATLRSKTFGFIFQRYNLISTLSAQENVEIPAIYAGFEKADRGGRATDLLKGLGLEDRRQHRPNELSGGQQQRVAIARALINDAPIILADEPTGALDSGSGSEVISLLKQLHVQGRTIILITHEEKIANQAQRIIRIADGKILESDSGKTDFSGDITEAQKAKTFRPDAARHNFIEEITESAKMALRSLKVNLFRTVLTLLGIIIGVASVIVMMAVGDGSKQKVLTQISSMGTNLLSIRPGAPGIRGSGDIATLVPADSNAISEVSNVDSVVPERSGRLTARYGNLDYMTTIQGVGESHSEVREWPISIGSFFTEQDVKAYAPVALLGKTVLSNLFPNEPNPVGKFIVIKNIPFEIIGIMSTKGTSSWGNDQDDAIFIPYSTGNMRLFGKSYLNGITVKVRDVDQIDSTQKSLEQLLSSRHHNEDFSIKNMASLIAMASETQNTLTVLLAAVAAISLLVGGIGVMNIMLVSVTERTREIGIRMATGAKKRDISLQFGTEASVVCVLGGLIGVALGLLVGIILNFFQVSIIFHVGPALLAFACAVGTGLLFGYLPAKKAASLDPVVALASE